MTLTRYIIAITAAYLATFCAIFWHFGGFPTENRLKVLGVIILVSAVMSSVFTVRAMQLANPNEPRFLLPTVIHGFVLLTVAVCAANV
jgi:hypothetical protein